MTNNGDLIMLNKFKLSNPLTKDNIKVETEFEIGTGNELLIIPEVIANELQLSEIDKRTYKKENGEIIEVSYVGLQLDFYEQTELISAVVYGNKIIINEAMLDILESFAEENFKRVENNMTTDEKHLIRNLTQSLKNSLRRNRMIIYIDMDDVLCHFESEKQRQIEANPDIAFPQSIPGFFENLKPIAGAIESVKKLIQSEKYSPYILTAPSILNPHCYTEKRLWVEKYFGMDFVDKLIICSNKGLLKGDVLIDDYIEGRGQENFEGEFIHFGSEKFPNWRIISQYLDSKF